MFKILSVMLFFSFPVKLLGQVSMLTGKIVNNDNNGVVRGANISVYNNSDIVFRATSDSSGNFNIPLSLLNKTGYIKISAFNFKELTIDARSQQSNNSLSLGIFKMAPQIIELMEVKVKASKRYKDTTKVDLSGQKLEQSIMINDLFSKYGLSKDANGILYYKGKPVSDVVVNGGSFFGKNNMDVYNLLPALALKSIEITETNIDSVTNTTTLHPVLKVNLKLKEQYNKGKFGNSNLAFGTQKRNLLAANVYTYRNNEQITISANTNNINIGNSPPVEPVIGFSANGNDVKLHNLQVDYHNILFNKVELNLSVKGKQEAKNYRSESVREDEALNQSSTIINSSDTRSHGLSDINLSLVYKVDSRNDLALTHTGSYYKTTLNDSLNYAVQYQDVNSFSNLTKNRISLNNTGNTEIVYKRLSSAKKGRQIDITVARKSTSDKNTEKDLVTGVNDKVINSYFILSDQNLHERTYKFGASFTEPSSDYSSYINLFASYSNSFISYKPAATSDSLNINMQPAELTNQYLQSGIKYRRTLNKISFDASLKGLLNLRSTLTDQKNNLTFFDLNGYLKTDYKFNNKKSVKLTLQTVTEYPETYQLVNVNNSFDLISQTSNNVSLKPQIKNSLSIGFDDRSSDTENININADLNYYLKRFGLNINALPNTPQAIFIDNLGNAIASNININISRDLFRQPVNFYSTVSYFEQPTILNGVLNKNNGFNLSQSIAISKQLVKDILSISPMVGGTYGRYLYSSAPINTYTLNYTDKIILKAAKFELELHPLATYSHSISDLFSFSMNAGIKRRIFKSYGLVWLQGYDIFNSFKIQNNLFGSFYKQTTQYSNINRYVVLGLSFKFNNIK